MDTILVYYKEIAVGELNYKEGNFVYNTYESGLNEATSLAYPLFLYQIDQDFVSPTLPASLLQWLPNENDELYADAGIIESDNDFEKLAKVSKLNLVDENVYIKLKK